MEIFTSKDSNKDGLITKIHKSNGILSLSSPEVGVGVAEVLLVLYVIGMGSETIFDSSG